MASYKVSVHILISDIEGNDTQQSWENIFDDTSKSLFDLRSEAIEKYKSNLDFFENDVTVKGLFSSPMEVKRRNHKDFKAFSVDLTFIDDNGQEYYLTGFGDSLAYLVEEADYYKSNDINVDFGVIEYDGIKCNVIEKDFELFFY